MEPSLLHKVIDAYGPYGFGVVCCSIIVAVLVFGAERLYSKVLRPGLESWRTIASSNAVAAEGLRDSSENLRAAALDIRITAQIQSDTQKRQDEQAATLAAITERLRREAEGKG